MLRCLTYLALFQRILFGCELVRYWVVVVGSGVQSKAAENSFNAVRLLAALQVAYIHAIAHLKLSPTWGYGWIAQFPGVPIFFAVSGYLVFDSLLRLQSAKSFFKHRAARIYPALLVNIAVMEVAMCLAGQVAFQGSLRFLRGVAFYIVYAFTANMDLANKWIGGGGGLHSYGGFFRMYPSGVLWTLTVELTFYAAIPLFLFTKTRATQTALAITLSLLSFFYQKNAGAALPTGDYWPQSISVIPYFWMFGIGILFRLWTPPLWSFKLAVPVLCAAYYLTAQWRGLAWFEWKVDPLASASVQTVLLCLLSLWIGSSPLVKSRWLADNDMSYGLYLYHMMIVTALMNAPTSQWLLLAVLVGGMLAGLLSWRLVERPAMKRMRNSALPLTAIRSPA
jgi:peptidoglycan/LPS O-acetylase OafA/YrhL